MKGLHDIGNAFAAPVLEGIKKFAEAAQKIVNGAEAALKMVIKLGSWFIPGMPAVAKAAMKALDAALPPGELKTGNDKADKALAILGNIL
jgi:hypothetical protein